MDTDITVALTEWAAGDKTALDRIAPAVYPLLRDLAAGMLSRERAGHTWQATALVNELFLKLIAQREPHFENRRHFYNVCAKLMRLALIDHARESHREKRGGARTPVPLHEDVAWFDAAGPEAVDLDRLLTELARLDPEQEAMFETRYLLGCSVEETAELFQTSKSAVDRKTRIARGWLYRRLTKRS
ncbi:MAG: sigma-70 family RNA polymerase sigma factor [Bryobacterales bacterium]|nr:sigma-70 family RNA polymerase sigma factor [Bryobacterales bacterium]